MKYNTKDEFGLKQTDIDILKSLDESLKLDKQKALINYYYKKNCYKDLTEQYDSEIVVKSIEDLLEKYNYFNLSYKEEDHILMIRKPIPVKLYTLLRLEAEQFKFNDILVITDRGGKIVL